MINKLIKLMAVLTLALGFSASAYADTTMTAEGQYIFNSLAFYIGGVLVAFMAAGFCMLETGLVRAKNAVVQCAKNIGLYSIAGIMFAIVGYNLMYMDVSGWIGSLAIWSPSDGSLNRLFYVHPFCDHGRRLESHFWSSSALATSALQ